MVAQPIKMKYNLTFGQRLELIPIWFLWFFYAGDKKDRATWHNIKKGMEKHEHKYTIPNTKYYLGENWHLMKCEHEGCNSVELKAR